MNIQNKGDGVDENFKSDFLSDAEQAKQKLDNVSPSLCLAKWKQVSLHLTNGMNNSCYHPPLHQIDASKLVDNPSALHNTDHKKQMRKMMLQGERPKECSYCWNMEDLGNLSDRHYRSGEPWANKDFDIIASSGGYEDVLPSYVEVNFNNACNLKCSYCSPQFSSTWMAEAEQYGAFPTQPPHNDPKYFTGSRRPIPTREHNPYVNAFWKWWPELYPELEHFRMTGGEPLMDRNTYRVFDYVLENPNPKLHLNVTSNFSVEEKLWQRYLTYVQMLCETDKIEHFMQYVSLDAWDAKAEYIRHGLDFNLLWDRVNQFLELVPERNSLTFIVTMNALSVTSIDKLFVSIIGLRKLYSTTYQRVWFDTPVLRHPDWMSMQILPDSYVKELEKLYIWMMGNVETPETRFHGFKDYEIHRLDRDIDWMRDASSSNMIKDRANFYNFFSEHDRRRGTNFLKTFPEMKEFWEQCKYHSSNS